MKLKEILAVAGKPGLYKFISQGRNGIIVEGIADGKRMLIPSSNKVSAMGDIAIYTESEEIPLKEIFKKIFEQENGKQTISHKSPDNQIKEFFISIQPDYDKNRVYVSDIKKVINWYNLLTEHELFDPNEKEDDEDAATEASEVKTDKDGKSEKKAKATTSKNKPTPKSDKKPTVKSATKIKTTATKSKTAGTGKKPSA
jgi:hypothetical protein